VTDEAIEVESAALAPATQYRMAVAELVRAMREEDDAITGDQIEEVWEHRHEFAGDLYMRTLVVPAGHFLVTKIHKVDHPYFVMEGEATILTEDGPARMKAPFSGITRAGVQRVAYVHEQVTWTTVHFVGGERDTKKIVETVTTEDPLDPELLERDLLALGGER